MGYQQLDSDRIELRQGAHMLPDRVEFVGKRGTIDYYSTPKRVGVDMSFYQHIAEEVAVIVGGACRAIRRMGRVVYLVVRQ